MTKKKTSHKQRRMDLEDVYIAAGRPGAAKLRDAMRRRGLDVTLTQAQDFVCGQATAQVFAAPPKSEGKVTSPQLNERWQADLMDFKAQDPQKNKGYRAALLVVDIFSRFAYAKPLETKTSEEVAAAFERILSHVRRTRAKEKRSSARPTEVSTDSSNEFKGAFSELLNRLNVAQSGKNLKERSCGRGRYHPDYQGHHEEGDDGYWLRVLGSGPPQGHRGLQLEQPQRHHERGPRGRAQERRAAVRAREAGRLRRGAEHEGLPR